jgi:hypothetical protein
VDRRGVELLLAAVIEQAVHDRRLAVTHRLLDEECMPTGSNARRDALEITFGLRYFFFDGGLEAIAEEAGFKLPLQRIKEKSSEPYE